MATFTLTLSEGLNAVSIPLEIEGDNAKWVNILDGIAFNSIRTLTNGQWKDFIRGRTTSLNDFDSVDYRKGYLIDVIRVGYAPFVENLLPATTERAIVEVGESVYEDTTAALQAIPLYHSGAAWLKTTSSDYTDTSAAYLSFEVDRDVNLYVAYQSTATAPSWLNSWDDTGETIKANDIEYDIYRLPVAAGAYSLPGNKNSGGTADQMYLVFMEENLYPVTVSSPVSNQIARFDEGKTYYLDRAYIITDLPEEVEKIDWVRLNNSEYTDSTLTYFQATLPDEGYVYVAYPSTGCPIPEWLEEFDQLDVEFITNVIDYKLFRKWYDTGSVVLGGASAPTSLGSNASPGANYVVGFKKIGPAEVTVTVIGEEPSGIIEIPIVGTNKGGVSLIGFPKSGTAEDSIEHNIDNRNLKYENIMRLRKGVWEAYIPTRSEDLNWTPADLERGLGYIVKSSIKADQVLEIDYDG